MPRELRAAQEAPGQETRSGRRLPTPGRALRLQGGEEGRPREVPPSAALTACREQGLLSALVGVKVAHFSGQHPQRDVVSFKKWFLATEMAPEG